MEMRQIGSLQVSSVGLGCNNFGRRLNESGTRSVVHTALDEGITFFDTADTYGGTDSEVFLGRSLANARKDVVLATKFGWEIDDDRRGAHPNYVKRAVEDSLRRLGTDYIDLYQLHKPDPTVPIEDTLGALDDLVREGKVLEIGCSNFSSPQLNSAETCAEGGARFVSVQNEYSLLNRDVERGLIQECEQLDVVFLPYFPLASGLLTGKYRLGQPPPDGTRLTMIESLSARLNDDSLKVVESLIAYAEKHGHSVLELAFGWLLARSSVSSVIAGAMTSEQLRANVSAAKPWVTETHVSEVEELLPSLE